MQQNNNENKNLTPAEREFVSALRTVEPARCELDVFSLAFEAGARRERARGADHLRVWRGIACAASLAVVVSLAMRASDGERSRPARSLDARHVRVAVAESRANPVMNTEVRATSAPLTFVPTAGSARTLSPAPASALQRMLWIGVQP